MDSDTTSIGALKARLGLTARALRHYEEIGLISSKRGSCGVRGYGPEMVATIELIVQLRRVEVCLAEIRIVLRETRPSERARIIHKILSRMIVSRKRTLDDLERLIDRTATQFAEA